MLRLFRQYYSILNMLFIAGEGLVIFTSVVVANWIVCGFESMNPDNLLIMKSILITGICQLCIYFSDLYDVNKFSNHKDMALRLLRAVGITAILLAILYLLLPEAGFAGNICFISLVIVAFFVVFWHITYLLVLSRGLFKQKIMLLGSGELSEHIKQEIGVRKDCGYEIACGFSEKNQNESNFNGHQNFTCLDEKAQMLGIQKIVTCFREKRNSFPTNELLKCRMAGVEVLDGNTFYEMLTGKLMVSAIHPDWLIFSKGFDQSRWRQNLKRLVDVLCSSVLLVSCFPLMLIIAIAIKLDSEGPVLYFQERIGHGKKPFRLIKFRSMIDNAEKTCGPVWASENDRRITRVGHIIRKLRFDELPQVWNVLKGEMSFVGPRPERRYFVEQLEKKIPYYRQRFVVKPGISGWAQICYRYGASEDDATEKLNYELYYIKNMSLAIDLIIIFHTIRIVLFGRGSR